jgi:hypothetical protein
MLARDVTQILLGGNDAEHQQARRVADAVDDDPLAGVADLLVPGLVFLDIATVIPCDVQIGARRCCGDQRKQQQREQTAYQETGPRSMFSRRQPSALPRTTFCRMMML